MIVKSINLKNFRNYKNEKIDFIDEINIIYGDNAQGKTNILESIYLCSTSRSHRTSKIYELIKNDSEDMKININVKKDGYNTDIEYFLKKNDKKIIKIDDIQIKKTGQLMGKLSAVIFAPEDLKLIKDGPSERRRYIDIMISRIKPSYFYALQKYQKIIKQKNALLKEIQKDRKKLSLKEIWDVSQANEALKIIRDRKIIIEKLNKKTSKWYKRITENDGILNIEYQSNMDIENEKIEDIMEKIKNNKEREIETGNTLIGPHRDEIEIKINGDGIKAYGSQGQQRTAVLSMKLSEIEIIKEYTNEMPVLLLDDIMSELDEKRRKRVIENINKIQAFITCTDYDYLEKNIKNSIKYFKVKNGNIIKTSMKEKTDKNI